MARRKYHFSWIGVPAFFCSIGIIWLYQNHILLVENAFGFWLVMMLVIAGILLGALPRSVFHRMGRVVGHMHHTLASRRYQSKADVHEDKLSYQQEYDQQSYQQGYQANSSNTMQTILASPDEYELPQAQYPQQQLPPM